MITLNNVKVFDRYNPNFNIVNTDDEIIKLFENKYVPAVYNNNVLGFVKEITEVKDGAFYGTVVYYKDVYSNLINYEVQIKGEIDERGNGKISNVMCVEFGYFDRG